MSGPARDTTQAAKARAAQAAAAARARAAHEAQVRTERAAQEQVVRAERQALVAHVTRALAEATATQDVAALAAWAARYGTDLLTLCEAQTTELEACQRVRDDLGEASEDLNVSIYAHLETCPQYEQARTKDRKLRREVEWNTVRGIATQLADILEDLHAVERSLRLRRPSVRASSKQGSKA